MSLPSFQLPRELPDANAPYLPHDTFSNSARRAGVSGDATPVLDLKWAWLWSILPPILLLALVLGLGNRPTSSSLMPTTELAAGKTDSVSLPLSQTMVVALRDISGYTTLRGNLAPGGDVAVNAPRDGQVARLAVQVGQHVEAGDLLLDLSVGAPPLKSTPAEKVQNAAEAAQVAVAHTQDDLQTNLADAQQRMAAAQQRVDAAQQRVARARELVQRLQRGEVVMVPDSELNPPPVDESHNAHQEAQADDDAGTQSRQAAVRQAAHVEQLAETAQQNAASAAAAADDADKLLQSDKDKIQAAQVTADKTQRLFDEGIVAGSQVEDARAALTDALSAETSATTRAAAAHDEATRLAATAESLKQVADQANANAAQAMRQLRLFAPTPERAAPSQDDQSKEAGKARPLTVERAAGMVLDAVAQSDKAIHDAQLIRQQLDGYNRQVNSTKQSIDRSGKNLEAAQNEVIQNTIHASLQPIYASAPGIVIALPVVATDVKAGDPLVTLAQSGELEAQLADTSGAWKLVHPGMAIAALVQPVPMAPAAGLATRRPRPAPATGTFLAPPSGLRQSAAIPTIARVREVVAPVARAAALLRVGIANAIPAGKPGHLDAGDLVTCSLPRPGSRPVLCVPSNAVARGNANQSMLAVLVPLALPNDRLRPPRARTYRVEWRPVTLGSGDGIDQEVVAGLKPGERIALRPSELQILSTASGEQVVVRLSAI